MADPRFYNPHLETVIKNLFYNTLVNNILDDGDFNLDNINTKLIEGIAKILSGILKQSMNCDGIRLGPNIVINLANCPKKYTSLFEVLLDLKQQNSNQQELNTFAQIIMTLDSFQEINPVEFLIGASGVNDAVTPELIRLTFYNEMAWQIKVAVKHNLLQEEDILHQEPQIYFSLPALTLLKALQKSKGIDGINLLYGKVLTQENCPITDNFPLLVQQILLIKKGIESLSDKQIETVKYLLCNKELTEEMQGFKTKALMDMVTIINNMAIEISKNAVFHDMGETVRVFACDILKPAMPIANKLSQ